MDFNRRHALLVALLPAIASCTSDSVSIDPRSPDLLPAPSPTVIDALPPVCGVVTVTDLLADQVLPAGTVEISNDGTSLFVSYQTSSDWPIHRTALWVGDDIADLPLTNGGNPRLGRFPYQSEHTGSTHEVVHQIPLDGLTGSEAVVAAFAEVGEALEGAWADGENISPAGSWAMYTSHVVVGCTAETVGARGAKLTSPSGDATLTIPPGALDESVVITLEQSSVEELLEMAGSSETAQVDGTTAVSALTVDGQTLEGVVPIEGTVWDLGPDGQEFLEPVILTLKYADADLPQGTDELLLGVFVVNGFFDRADPTLPDPVDPQANTVSAQLQHFSHAFVGVASADLSITDLSGSPDPVERNLPVAWTGNLTNNGPADIHDGIVTYQGFGDVEAGPLSTGCTEQTPIVATVAIVCSVGTVIAGGSVEAPAASFIPLTTSSEPLEVWARAGTREAEDPNPDNDVAIGSYKVIDPVADMEIVAFTDAQDPVPAGQDVAYTIQVGTDVGALQPVEGALLELSTTTATFQSAGDPACFATSVGASCPLPTLGSGQVHGIDFTMRPVDGVDRVLVNARVILPHDGTTDPDLSNNTELETTAIGPGGTADLTVSRVSESADPIELGQSVKYAAEVSNFGPDGVLDAVVYYRAFGDLEAGALSEGCSEIAVPAIADVAIECEVGALGAPGITYAPAAWFVPRTTGTFTMWIEVASSATDPNPGNDRLETDFTAVAPEADLAIPSFFDFRDPVPSGRTVGYRIEVGNLGSLQPVEGATLAFTTAGATFNHANDPACFDTSIGATCPLPTLAAGESHTIDLSMLPAEGVQQVNVTAKVVLPQGTVDPDLSNNTAVVTTTIRIVDLALTGLTESADPALVGATLTYTATVENLGPDDSQPFSVWFTVEGGEVQTGSLEPNCSVASQEPGVFVDIECFYGSDLAAGGQVTISATVVPQEEVGSLKVQATVSDFGDPDLTNNTLEEQTLVTTDEDAG